MKKNINIGINYALPSREGAAVGAENPAEGRGASEREVATEGPIAAEGAIAAEGGIAGGKK
jgi:hypothetical protein